MVVLSVPWHMYLGLGTDPSWGLTMSERLLDGDRLYVDILHTNPPLNAWLNVPAVAFARWTGISPELALYLRGYLVVAFGVGLLAYSLHRSTLAERRLLPVLIPATLTFLLILIGGEFGQREHLGAALFLPLLVTAAQRSVEETPTRTVAMVVGVSASFLILLKPHFAVVVVALMGFAAWMSRSWRPIVCTETVILAAVSVVYLLWTRAVYPELFSDVIPLMDDTYLRVTHRDVSVILAVLGATVLGVGFVLVRTGAKLTPLIQAYALGSLAAWLPFIAQGKNWRYHAFPALVMGLTALVLRAVTASRSGRSAPMPATVRATVVAVIFLGCIAPFTWRNRPDPDLVATLTDPAVVHAEHPVVLTFAPNPSPGFPLTRQIDGTFPSRWAHDWYGASALLLRQSALQRGDQREAERLLDMARSYRTHRLDELELYEPDVILVDLSQELWSNYMWNDPRFDRLLRAYEVAWEDEEIAAYVRRSP